VQRLVHRDAACVVTLLDAAPLARPLTIDGRVALAPGAPAIWFTFAGAWHDIGRFHDADHRFTGLYANVLTPVAGFDGRAWRTTDLFLDVWLPAGEARARLLDEDELNAAVANGLDPTFAARARAEGDSLLARAAAGTWPPPVVERWTLERVRQALDGGTSSAPPV
jgi:predicted RNA-binding protein associated with RNAse of E/G family